MTELIIALGQKSLYIGNNTKTKMFKGLNICREKLGTRYPGFTPRFWSESPNPNYYAQNRIAGIALSELVDFPEIYREVYFPTVEALIPLSKKVDRVVFLLWETPHNRQEFSEHWWDTATLAPVLKAYMENQGVTNVCFETIRTSSIDNVEEVQAQVLSLCLSSTFLNVQDAPLSIVHAITKRIKESEWIWQTTVTSREIGTMLERSGKGNAITKTIKEADWFWQTSKTSQDLETMLEKSVKGAEYIWLLDHRNAVLGRPITPSIN